MGNNNGIQVHLSDESGAEHAFYLNNYGINSTHGDVILGHHLTTDPTIRVLLLTIVENAKEIGKKVEFVSIRWSGSSIREILLSMNASRPVFKITSQDISNHHQITPIRFVVRPHDFKPKWALREGQEPPPTPR